MRLPTFESVQRFMSLTQPGECWGALNFDVRGAHKLVKVAPAEQGLSCFVVKGRWFAYRSCYFGCRWAAYWFSRVGAFLVRHCHQFLWVKHGFFLYVDDGLALFPAGLCPLLATSLLLFLAALGVPLSWEKVRMGHLQNRGLVGLLIGVLTTRIDIGAAQGAAQTCRALCGPPCLVLRRSLLAEAVVAKLVPITFQASLCISLIVHWTI